MKRKGKAKKGIRRRYKKNLFIFFSKSTPFNLIKKTNKMSTNDNNNNSRMPPVITIGSRPRSSSELNLKQQVASLQQELRDLKGTMAQEVNELKNKIDGMAEKGSPKKGIKRNVEQSVSIFFLFTI